MQGLSAIGCRLSAVGWAVFPNVGDVRLSDIRHRGFPNARGGRLRRPFIMRPSGRHHHPLNPLNLFTQPFYTTCRRQAVPTCGASRAPFYLRRQPPPHPSGHRPVKPANPWAIGRSNLRTFSLTTFPRNLPCLRRSRILSDPFHGFLHGCRQGLAEEAVHGVPGDKPGAA